MSRERDAGIASETAQRALLSAPSQLLSIRRPNRSVIGRRTRSGGTGIQRRGNVPNPTGSTIGVRDERTLRRLSDPSSRSPEPAPTNPRASWPHGARGRNRASVRRRAQGSGTSRADTKGPPEQQRVALSWNRGDTGRIYQTACFIACVASVVHIGGGCRVNRSFTVRDQSQVGVRTILHANYVSRGNELISLSLQTEMKDLNLS
ncbi:hypothetical protein SEVIR_2G251950v4 [Setaria viridis]